MFKSRVFGCARPLERLFSNVAVGSSPHLLYAARSFTAAARADGDLINIKPLLDLKGRTYVVTGGGRGIGYAAARAIAEFGGNVSIFDAAPAPVKDFQNLEAEFGVKARYFCTDVTQEPSLSRAFEQTVKQLGTINGCVTAAGVCPEGAFVDHSWAEVRKCFEVNITGTFFSAQMASRYMLEAGRGGSIVMIASISGHCATPGHRLSAYNASKGAVRMLSTALSVELGPSLIRVNSISPGYTDTELLTPLKEREPKRIELMRREPPMDRIGTRSDLAPAVVYLLSDASSYTTGTDIIIDGGLHGGRIRSPYL